MNIATKWISWAPQLRSVLRIVAAFIFITAGTTKLMGFPTGMPGGGTMPLMTQLGIGALLEVVGGALLLLGLFTRPVAFILAGEMAVAYFQFHAPGSFWPTINQGIPAILYCFIWLYFSTAGPGPWSLDAIVSNYRMRSKAEPAGRNQAEAEATSEKFKYCPSCRRGYSDTTLQFCLDDGIALVLARIEGSEESAAYDPGATQVLPLDVIPVTQPSAEGTKDVGGKTLDHERTRHE